MPLTSKIANALKSATTIVNVSAAAAPTNGQVLTATGGTTATWQTAGGGFDPSTTVELMEDFMTGENNTTATIGLLQWRINGTGATTAVIQTGSSTLPLGVIRVLTPAAASGGGIRAQEASTVYPSTGNVTVAMRAKNVAAANANLITYIGIHTQPASDQPPSDGIYFSFSGTGNWLAVTRQADTETSTDTGVAQSTSFKTFEILTNSDATSITFYIDGALEATHSTNIPTAAVYFGINVVTADSTARGLDCDYFYYKITGLSR